MYRHMIMTKYISNYLLIFELLRIAHIGRSSTWIAKKKLCTSWRGVNETETAAF